MGEHAWTPCDNGTAYYCAQCRMRVDNDEFVPGVEESLCVPFIPPAVETYKPYGLSAMGDANEPMRSASLSASIVNAMGGSVQAREFVDNDGFSRVRVTAQNEAPAIDPYKMSLVAFVEMVGFDMHLSKWQIDMLKSFDRHIEEKRRRGLSN